MALHLAIEDAPTHLEDRPPTNRHHTLPEHGDDYSWDDCSDLLFQDHDVLKVSVRPEIRVPVPYPVPAEPADQHPHHSCPFQD
ncbi:hypothetical protein ACFV19_32455 [Streptomyces griseoluteus]|uniref:hypothetical protein n=1 Tax=Streptomyces griseoluteus TaxID=29306 RepID=UPI0036B518F2